MSKPRQYNPRKHHRINEHLLDKAPRKSHLEHLFDQIKQMETQRASSTTEKPEAAIVAPPPAEQQGPVRNIDENIEKEFAPKHSREIKLVKTTESKQKAKESKSSLTDFTFKPEQENPLFYIASDNRLSSMLEYTRIIDEYVDMMEHVDDQYQYCCSRLSEAEKEVQDFLHELRQPKKNAFEGFKLYQIGHNIQLKRQAYKDCAAILKPLANQVRANKEQIERMKNISDYLKSVKQTKENRIYMQRSSLKLPVGDAFRALAPAEQEVIRRNYEEHRAQNQAKKAS